MKNIDTGDRQRARDDQRLTGEGAPGIRRELEALRMRQAATEDRLAHLEEQVASLRNSAIRGEIASGRKTVDTARKFSLSAARVSQIAPRRRYNNG